MRFYEDYPYIVRDPAGLERSLARLAERSRWQGHVVPLSPTDLQGKVAAVMAYASQLGVLFPGDGAEQERVAAALQGHAQHTGHGQPAERLWQLQPFGL